MVSQGFQLLVGSSFEEVLRGMDSVEASPQHVFTPTLFELELLNFRSDQAPHSGTLTMIGGTPGIVLKTTEWQYRAALFLTNEVLNSFVKPVSFRIALSLSLLPSDDCF